MPTRLNYNRPASREGVNYVRSVVEQFNCTLTEPRESDDAGIDGYVEFTQGNEATGCCIAVQIKSGASFSSLTGSTYCLPADKDHFEYWAEHSLPVAGIVYDPLRKRAVWCSITDYLSSNPQVVKTGPYRISIAEDNEFSEHTFQAILQHFLTMRDLFRSTHSFGRALELFADTSSDRNCRAGLLSLFHYHRNRPASWYYLISGFSHIKSVRVRSLAVVLLSHLPGHGDIFWHENNIIDGKVRQQALLLLRENLDERAVRVLLDTIDDVGLSRGSIGQCVYTLVDVAPNKKEFLRAIALDPAVREETRYFALIILIAGMYRSSPDERIGILSQYLSVFPEGEDSDLVRGIISELKETGEFDLF